MSNVETRTVEPDEAGMRLDRWFRAHFPELSFGRLQKLLRSGQVRVDGGRVKTNTRLEPGQTVRIPPLGGASGRFGSAPTGASGGSTGGPVASSRPVDGRRLSDTEALRAMILFQDDAVFVFNKPPGLAVQGGSGVTRHVDGMLEAFRDRKGQKPRLVHRLDRDTSGVLVVARTRLAAQKLAAAFRRRTTRKVYWALVRGVPKPRQGRISTWLAKGGGPEGDRMRVAAHGQDEASHAVSLYSVVEQAGQKLSWLTMRPVTGRTHQLRAHAAHIGHPIIGDPKYFENEDWQLPGGMQNKLHLHARRIVIPHPSDGTLDVTAPLPPHMHQSWSLLGLDPEMGDRQQEDDTDD
ncbi:MAG: RluA family pseudouridine synthase [Hyphomicrobiales bacterium]|nr:RluA family pseudouridine synthase [Hyphomicrobiales bacterium]